MNKPIIVFVGPSGSGKTSLAKLICKLDSRCKRATSHTDRGIRVAEIAGVDYIYVSPETFQDMIKHDDFVEHNEGGYLGRWYGTSYREIERITMDGNIPVLDINIVGAEKIRKKYGDSAYIVYVQTPSYELLRNRLENRGDTSQVDVDLRMQKAIEVEDPFAKSRPDVFNDIVYNTEDTKLEILANKIYNDFAKYAKLQPARL